MSNRLEAWLAIANRGLSAESAAAVRTEIGAHYEDAYEEATARGSHAAEAERTAVAALGSPWSANREYRRVLLTAREAKLLRQLRHSSESHEAELQIARWLASVTLVTFCILAALLPVSMTGIVIAGLILLLVVQTFIAINTKRRGRLYRTARWIWLIIAAYATYTGGAVWYFWIVLCGLVTCAYGEYQLFSIRRKIPVEQWPKRLM